MFQLGFIRSFVWSVAIAALVLSGATVQSAEATSAGKIIGGVRGPTGIMRPLRADEVTSSAVSFSAAVEQLATEVKIVKLDPNAPKDEIERQFNGAISLARHQAELNTLRDQFTRCMTTMQQEAKAAEAEGTISKEMKQQLDACDAHCSKVLAKLNALHHNTGMLASATRQSYFLDAWDKHKQMISDLQSLAKECPMMMQEAMGNIEKATPATSKDETTHKEHGHQ